MVILLPGSALYEPFRISQIRHEKNQMREEMRSTHSFFGSFVFFCGEWPVEDKTLASR
jgi:hypothetical protein